MKKQFRIIVINPGSTSTKISVFDNEKKIYTQNIVHPLDELIQFNNIVDQLEYRKNSILNALSHQKIPLDSADAFSGLCTGLLPMPGGVYEVNELMYKHGSIGIGSKHPGNLGPMLAFDLAKEYGGRAFVVNPSSIDEFCTEARLTGFSKVLRSSRGHPLNQKEVAIRFAQEKGTQYSDINLIGAHMGGGISVAAHKKGKIIDMIDSTLGEGRMAPTRSGGLPAAEVVRLCFSGQYTES